MPNLINQRYTDEELEQMRTSMSTPKRLLAQLTRLVDV